MNGTIFIFLGAFCLFLTVGLVRTKYAGYDLKHVYVTARGARHTPQNSPGGYPIVKHPKVPTELAQEGANIAFAMGRKLAKKYGNDILGKRKSWRRKDYCVFGDHTEWTKQSAFVLGAGLRNDTKDKKKAAWKAGGQKVKSIQEPLLKQIYMIMDQEQCPGLFMKISELRSQFVAAMFKFNATLMKVAQNTNVSVAQNPMQLWILSEALQTMKTARTKPEWADEKVMQDLDQIAKHFLFIVQYTDELKRLTGGRLADDIIMNMEALKKSGLQPWNPNNATLSSFSPTQTILAGLVAAMSPNGTLFKGKPFDEESFYPQQGAMHVLELHKKQNEHKWKVRVLYRNDRSTDLSPVQLPGCDKFGYCDYEHFKKTALRLTERQLKNECSAIWSGPLEKPKRKPNRRGKKSRSKVHA